MKNNKKIVKEELKNLNKTKVKGLEKRKIQDERVLYGMVKDDVLFKCLLTLHKINKIFKKNK